MSVLDVGERCGRCRQLVCEDADGTIGCACALEDLVCDDDEDEENEA